MMQQSLAYKYAHWSYENEFRAFVDATERCPETGLVFLPFSEGLKLKEIILGPECRVTSRELKTALLDQDAEIITSRLAFTSFTVTPQLRKDLQK